MNKNYSLKQIQKYNRQKLISALNKCTKNLYKIFKNPNSSYESYKTQFIELKKEINRYNNVYIKNDHIKKTKEYIENLYKNTISYSISQNEFNKLKNKEVSNLNRLQKIKNQLRYKKTKDINFEY